MTSLFSLFHIASISLEGVLHTSSAPGFVAAVWGMGPWRDDPKEAYIQELQRIVENNNKKSF